MMISHKMRLLFLSIGMMFLSSVSRGEIVNDCDLIRQAKQYGAINPQLVLAVAEIESSKNSSEISRMDSRNVHYGLMQLKPETAKMLGFRGQPRDLLQWRTNLKYGVVYLNQKLKKYHSKQAAAAAYNAGAAFPCKKEQVKCSLGEFVNQRYVDLVMQRYRKHQNTRC